VRLPPLSLRLPSASASASAAARQRSGRATGAAAALPSPFYVYVVTRLAVMSSRSVRFAGFVRPGDVPDDDDDRGDRRRQNRRHDDHQDRDRDRDRRRDQEEVDIDRPLSARELEDMFFGPKQHFKRTPDEYGEFPDFHDKYQQAQRIKAQRLAASSGGSGRAQAAAPENSPFDVPAEYDQRYRLNFAVFGTPLPSHMKHHEAQVCSCFFARLC